MHLIRLKNAKHGMKTAKEVMDPAGNVLLQPGAELTERTMELLGKRGVESVWVESTEDMFSPGDIGEIKEKLSAELDTMFEGRLDDEVMAYLHKSAKRHLIDKLGK